MRPLLEILVGVPVDEVRGLTGVDITAITQDSRKVIEGTLFFAVKGTETDGHNYINSAIEKGARVIVCEEFPGELNDKVTYITVKDSSEALATAACNFYYHPSKKLTLVGVTGTNGKTTIATLLFNLFRLMGHKVGLLSTVENKIDAEVIPATHTTPDPIALNELLNKMVDAGCEYCFMEVSSHAIAQNRVFGLKFAGGIFTNLSHDHLDYHKTFDNYIKAKKKFFDDLDADAFALTNKDDKNGMVMLQNTAAAKYTYSMESMSDFKVRVIEHDFNGMLLNVDGEEAWYSLVGKFNAYNLLAVYAAAFLLHKDKMDIIMQLTTVKSVEGRLEYVQSTNKVVGIVDYAHTPDALKNVLATINEIRTQNEQLITVVGCGGNRDKAKRPIMAKVATDMSDKVIFTSDNPRNEDPEVIIDEMEKGVAPNNYKKTLRISDRKQAIKAAVAMAKKGDIILVAGKGHEKYQEVNGVKTPFDDKQLLLEMFQAMSEQP